MDYSILPQRNNYLLGHFRRLCAMMPSRGSNRVSKKANVGLVLTVILLLSGCVSLHKFYEDTEANRKEVALLYTYVYRNLFLSDKALVERMDGFKTRDRIPVEILAGEHVVKIIYRKDTFLCNSFPVIAGCIDFRRSNRSLTFLAEPNRSYAPLVQRWCKKDWYWIEDWGPYDPEAKIKIFLYFPEGVAIRQKSRWIIAGAKPPGGPCE